jgi:PAS domain S-box-containing protein
LLDKEEQFKRLARQSRTCTWEINPDGLYTYCCQVFSDLTGYREEEIVGRMHFFDLHPERGRKEFKRAALETIARQDNFLDLENPIQTREGLIIWVSTTAVPVLDNDGKLLGYSGSDTDITKRKQAQETHDILHRQLMQSQKMEVVGQLAGGVAHDFNNILSVMLLHLHLNKTNNNAEFLTELEIQVARASNLTRQLLLFSRKEALHIESIQLNEVIRNLIKMLHRLIEENITIDLQLEPQLPLIEADAGMMEQVLTNLSINARDAMPRGGILFIKTEHVQWTESHPQTGTPRSPGNYVRLTVSDTGSGMDESVVARMFEPFFTTKEAGKGTGLGLATVHGIVQQHGGWIGVASKMGSGSAFTIHLPVSKSSVAQTLPVRSNNSPLVGGFETILIAEDDFNLRSMTSKTLRQYGYEVMEAADGQQALAMGKEKSGEIHLLLADMVMPGGLSGLELAARLSEIQPSLKVLLITGYALEVAVKKADSGEKYALLRKPCGVPALLAAVRHCLDGKAGTNEEK